MYETKFRYLLHCGEKYLPIFITFEYIWMSKIIPIFGYNISNPHDFFILFLSSLCDGELIYFLDQLLSGHVQELALRK